MLSNTSSTCCTTGSLTHILLEIKLTLVGSFIIRNLSPYSGINLISDARTFISQEQLFITIANSEQNRSNHSHQRHLSSTDFRVPFLTQIVLDFVNSIILKRRKRLLNSSLKKSRTRWWERRRHRKSWQPKRNKRILTTLLVSTFQGILSSLVEFCPFPATVLGVSALEGRTALDFPFWLLLMTTVTISCAKHRRNQPPSHPGQTIFHV